LDARSKSILAKVYASQFIEDIPPLEYIGERISMSEKQLIAELELLQKKNLVNLSDSTPFLTQEGRKCLVVVMAGGAFDILHPGHIETLAQARALGDVLIVSVARDVTFERNKKRKAHHDELLRRKLVSALKTVDAGVLGSETDIFETVLRLKPNIIALGYDQYHTEDAILAQVKKRGLDVKVVRLKSSVPDIKTSSLITRSEALREI
jgi:cytidyltransferase-like protein